MLLWYADRPHRPRQVAARGHPVPQLVEVVPLLAAELGDAHGVHARRPSVGPDLLPRLVDEALGYLKRLHLRLRPACRLLPLRVDLQVTLVCPAPSLQLHYRAFIAPCEPVRPCAPHRYSAARGSRRLRASLSRAGRVAAEAQLNGRVGSGTTGSPVPCQRLQRAHAPSTPGTARTTRRPLPGFRHAAMGAPFSRRNSTPPVSMPSFSLSTRRQRFTHVRLPVAHHTR